MGRLNSYFHNSATAQPFKDDSPLPPRLFFHLFQIQQIITINTTTNKTRQSINNGSISSCDWSVFASASTSEIILFTNFQTFLLIWIENSDDFEVKVFYCLEIGNKVKLGLSMKTHSQLCQCYRAPFDTFLFSVEIRSYKQQYLALFHSLCII